MSRYSEFIIGPNEIKEYDKIPLTFKVNNKRGTIFVGKVVCGCENPINNAAVQIFEIDKNYFPTKITDLGYVTTNEEGEFAIKLKSFRGIYYRFEVYEPLKMGCE